MHPIERLRYVARSTGADQRTLVRETAAALSGLGGDTQELVVACRRIVGRHPSAGVLWWLCAHVLTAPDPLATAWRLADEVEADPTERLLAAELPDGCRVAAVGWPDLIADVLCRRGDATVLAVDSDGRVSGMVRQLERAEVEVHEVPAAAIATAAASSELVLIEANSVSPVEALCPMGSRALAAAAYCAEVPVWLVAGIGRRLPEAMHELVARRHIDTAEPWALEHELVPLSMVSHVAGPNGVDALHAGNAAGLLAAECPVAPELMTASRG